jgi:methionyl-tRNA synthetase
LPAPAEYGEIDGELIRQAENLLPKVAELVDKLFVPDALNEIIKLSQACNKYIDTVAPWILNKNGEKKKLNTVLYTLAETIRIIAVLLSPFLPETAEKILTALSANTDGLSGFDGVKKFGGLKAGSVITKIPPIFPRIDVAKELKYLEENDSDDSRKTIDETTEKRGIESPETTEKATESAAEDVSEDTQISIDEFMKVKLKTAKVVACERVEKSDKLLKLTAKCGDEIRTIVSGIAHKFSPEEMIGKTVVIVANLKPAKLRGIMSEGMILCAEDGEHNLAIVTADIEDGSVVR